jgi:hypothetical protein
MRSSCFEEVGDAAALEHDGAARDLGGVGGEDWGDGDVIEQRAGLFGGDAGEAELAQRAAQRPALDGRVLGRELRVGFELAGEAAALAVVGLGEVDEFEVEAEGAGELVGGGGAEGLDEVEGVVEVGSARECHPVRWRIWRRPRGGRWRCGAALRRPRRWAGRPARAGPRRAACRASGRRGAGELLSARRWALAARPGAAASWVETRVRALSDYALARAGTGHPCLNPWLNHMADYITRASFSSSSCMHCREQPTDSMREAAPRAAMVGDAVAATAEEGADELAGLPGVEAGLHELLAQGGEVGLR